MHFKNINLETKCLEILKKYWGYPGFRPGQLEIIKAIIQNQSVLAILTTGGGKSICFQVAGLVLSGTTLVISPLISLMQDQVEQLRKIGIKAAAYNSTLSAGDTKILISNLKRSNLQFLYLAPESLQNKRLQDVLKDIEINLVAVDEAHCISLWGHDFRPSYLKINEALKIIVTEKRKKPKIAAFTATATPKVREDICQQLKMINPKVFLNSFLRKNMSINILKNYTDGQMLDLIEKRLKLSPILIYSSSRARVEDLAQKYALQSFTTEYYHGGLNKTRRQQVQMGFLKDKYQLLFATNAFGMGIDKPNIYTVIHDMIPDSVENFYQEAGRGGRDGSETNSYLNINWMGINLRKRMLENNFISGELANKFYNYLKQECESLKSTEVFSFSLQRALEELSGINLAKLINLLIEFHRVGIIALDPGFARKIDSRNVCASDKIKIKLLRQKILFLFPYFNFNKNKILYDSGQQKLKALINICLADACRMRSILEYFGEQVENCGKCDYCASVASSSHSSDSLFWTHYRVG